MLSNSEQGKRQSLRNRIRIHRPQWRNVLGRRADRRRAQRDRATSIRCWLPYSTSPTATRSKAELLRQFCFPARPAQHTSPTPFLRGSRIPGCLGCNLAYEEPLQASIASDYIGKRVLDLDYLPMEARLAYQAEDEQIIAEASGHQPRNADD